MSRRLVVHAGTYKTGTSRVQGLAWQHRASLLDQGWLYPTSGLRTDDPEVGVRHADLAYRWGDPRIWQRTVADLVAEVDASSARAVLLSTEAWSRPGHIDTLDGVLTALRTAGVVDDVEVVVYLRPRADYARSLYREYCRRRGNRAPFAAFVERSARPLDLLETVTSLRDAVAPHGGRLSVHPYETAGDVGLHLLGLLGVEVAEERRDPLANTGVGALDAEAMRWLNHIAPELAPHWPRGSSSLDRAGVAETLAPGQLSTTVQWREDLARATGWDDAAVARLCAVPPQPAHPVEALADDVLTEVRTWLASGTEAAVETTLFPHDDVEVFELRKVDADDKPWISGVLLLSEGASGWRLLGADGYREWPIAVDRDSPGLARRHPHRPDAARARWGTVHLEFGVHGRIDLLLQHDDGRRCVLATVRRVRRPRPPA